MAEFWHYFALTLPAALAVWALVEWGQRRRHAPPMHRREPTLDGPHPDAAARLAPRECPHPHFKRVYVRRDGENVATDEMQCVRCKARMRA